LNVLIIGASSGVGRETARLFSRKGHNLLCASQDIEELRSLTSDLSIRYGGEATAVETDLSDTGSVREMLKSVYDKYDILDCAIVTAGDMPANDTPYWDENSLIHTTATNYIGIAILLNEVSRRMVEQQKGTIICLSSVAGDRGRESNFIYGASKSALTAYLEGLRMKTFGSGVRVVTLIPGYIDTPMSYGKVGGLLTATPQRVAKKIYSLLSNKKNIIYIPSVWRYIMFAVKAVPAFIFKRMSF